MKTSRRRYVGERGALLGLVLFLAATAAADETLRERVQRQYRHQSYVLIETPGEPPRLLLLTPDAGAAPPAETAAEQMTEQMFERALKDLADTDPEVREEAVLALGDLDAGAGLLTALLDDPSPDVREAARAVLEDLDDSAE